MNHTSPSLFSQKSYVWRPLAYKKFSLLALAGICLAACGSSSSSVATTATTHSPSSNTSGNGVAHGSKINSLVTAMQSGKHEIFKATYTSSDGGSSTNIVTIEQAPPKSAFVTGGESFIDTGSSTYMCASDDSSGTPSVTCQNVGSSNPMAGMMEIFSPSTIVGELQSMQGIFAEHLAGYSISTSSRTYAGQPSTCVTLKTGTTSTTYCVTASGILSYVNSGSSVFELTSYTTNVSASDFEIPAGATVQTFPTT